MTIELIKDLRDIGQANDHSQIADVANRAAVELTNLATDAKYWRERCARYEANFHRLELASADIKGRVEQFNIVLQAVRPQGTEPKA
jgi:hypothetical protein